MRKLLLSASAVALLISGPAFAKNDKKADPTPPPSYGNNKPAPTPAPSPTPAPTPAPTPTPGPVVVKGKDPTGCTLADFSPAATACSGFYAGNLLGGSKDKIAEQVAGLGAIGFDWNGNFDTVTKIDSLKGATKFNFGKTLTDLTYVGIHFGGGGPEGVGNGTAFYKLDVGSGLTDLVLKYQGSSGVVLYGTGIKKQLPIDIGGVGPDAVPEPATWAMMIGGFGLVGGMMRRRRSSTGRIVAA